jgi:amphi-Trp domain-containing protein
MATRRRARDLERTYPRAQFVAKLRRLADAIEAGKPFTIQIASERLRVPADTAFNIEHERSGGTEEIEFQVRWTPD